VFFLATHEIQPWNLEIANLGWFPTWEPKVTTFFPSNAFMASARSLHAFNRGKQMNSIYMQGCQLVESHKSAGSGPVRSPGSSPSKKTNKQKPNQKQPKTSKQTKNTTTTKPKQTQHRDAGSQPAMGIHA